MIDSDPTLGRVIGGRYQVTARIGRGGMGAVYVARQHNLDRDVALKLIRVDLAYDPEVVARFEREARAVARLQHPHIVVVHDFGADEGSLFLAMERLVGTPLGERLRNHGPVPLPSALRITRDVAAALVCAHSNGVVHRDLKPDNIMLVTTDDRDDHAKVLDFGIAKIAGGSDPAVTTSRMVLGTPGYVAPEVIMNGMSDDPRADLYAVGVILFQMLAGHAPFFSATSAGATLVAQANQPCPRLETVAPQVPLAICDLVARLTARNPDERPSSAKELLDLLDRVLGRTGSGLLRLELPVNSSTLSFTTAPLLSTPTTTSTTTSTPTSTQSFSLLAGGVVFAEQPRVRRRWPALVAAAAVVGVLGVATSVIAMQAPRPMPPRPMPTTTVTATTTTPAPDSAPVATPGPAVRLAPVATPAPVVVAAAVANDEEAKESEPLAEAKPKPKPKPTTKSTPATKSKPATKLASMPPPPPKPAGPPPLTSALIKSGIESRLGKASSCTNTNIKNAPVGSGLLVDHCPSYKTVPGDHQVVLTVAPDGSVTAARFSDDTAASRIGACTLESLKSWKLPAFAAESPVEINQRVLFEPCVPINGKCIF